METTTGQLDLKRFKVEKLTKSTVMCFWFFLFVQMNRSHFISEPEIELLRYISSYVFALMSVLIVFSCRNKKISLVYFVFSMACSADINYSYFFCFTYIPYIVFCLERKEIIYKMIGVHILLCFFLSFYVDLVMGDSILLYNQIKQNTLYPMNIINVLGVCIFLWAFFRRVFKVLRWI